MQIVNLTNEPKTVPLRKKGGGTLRVYLQPKANKVIVERCEITEEAKALCKVRAILIKK